MSPAAPASRRRPSLLVVLAEWALVILLAWVVVRFLLPDASGWLGLLGGAVFGLALGLLRNRQQSGGWLGQGEYVGMILGLPVAIALLVWLGIFGLQDADLFASVTAATYLPTRLGAPDRP